MLLLMQVRAQAMSSDMVNATRRHVLKDFGLQTTQVHLIETALDEECGDHLEERGCH